MKTPLSHFQLRGNLLPTAVSQEILAETSEGSSAQPASVDSQSRVEKIQSPNHRPSNLSTTKPNTAAMPSEVSDIKHFIEICRRKDASCTFSL